jgi:glycosyltransferase involved in cell wall biosynthesis
MIELSRLRVCFLAGTLGQGGAERQLFYLLKTLREQGATVQLLTLTRGEFWEAPIAELGVDVRWVGQTQSRAVRLATIIRQVKAFRPDILQSQHFYTNLYAAVAARVLGVREIGALRCDGASEVAEHGRALGTLSLRWPRVIAANSQAAIDYAVQAGRSKTSLFFLPNAIDATQFFAHNGNAKPSDGIVRLLTAGRLEEQKRVDRLIRVLAELRRQSSIPFRAAIAGDGPLRSQLERQAEEAGLSDLIEFRGLVREMKTAYHQADIFLLTSDFEGTPNVVLEAMASGLPVLATNVGGVPDVIEHGVTGLLTAPQSETEFISQLRQLIEQPQMREQLGQAARARIEKRHALHQLPNELTDLYRLALA